MYDGMHCALITVHALCREKGVFVKHHSLVESVTLCLLRANYFSFLNLRYYDILVSIMLLLNVVNLVSQSHVTSLFSLFSTAPHGHFSMTADISSPPQVLLWELQPCAIEINLIDSPICAARPGVDARPKHCHRGTNGDAATLSGSVGVAVPETS